MRLMAVEGVAGSGVDDFEVLNQDHVYMLLKRLDE